MEEWKDITGYEEYYQISNLGEVKSLDRGVPHRKGKRGLKHVSPRSLSLFSDKDGYILVHLMKKGTGKVVKVHRLVAIAFTPNPENKPQVNHIDGNKKNNCIENLEWCTASENIKHSFATGLKDVRGEKNHRAKLTESKVRCIRLSNLSMTELSEIYSTPYSTIVQIKARKTWRNVQ